eukprot:365674-Chlamydomonas_euryale.AAC.4
MLHAAVAAVLTVAADASRPPIRACPPIAAGAANIGDGASTPSSAVGVSVAVAVLCVAAWADFSMRTIQAAQARQVAR